VTAANAACSGGGGTGYRYTYAQLEGLWIDAGGPRAVAPVAAAIALAESGGCSTALNPDDNNGSQSSFGLWQISNGTHQPPVSNIYNANVNAKQAVGKYKGAGDSFSPWGTYDSGAYKRYLNDSTTPVTTGIPTLNGGPTAGGSSGTPAQTGTCLLSAPKVLGFSLGGCLFSKTEARALVSGLMMAAGGLTLFAGLAVLTASAFAGTKAGKAAGRGLETVGAGVALIPGAEAAGAALAASGKGVKGVSGQVRQRRSQARTAAVRADREQVALERHTARQYARQPRSRALLARDDDRRRELDASPF